MIFCYCILPFVQWWSLSMVINWQVWGWCKDSVIWKLIPICLYLGLLNNNIMQNCRSEYLLFSISTGTFCCKMWPVFWAHFNDFKFWTSLLGCYKVFQGILWINLIYDESEWQNVKAKMFYTVHLKVFNLVIDMILNHHVAILSTIHRATL